MEITNNKNPNQMKIYRFNYDVYPLTKDNEKIRNRFGRYFLSRKFKQFEAEIKYLTIQQLPKGWTVPDKPVVVNIVFVFRDNRRRDVFNYTKSFCDALNGVLWKDDSLIKEGSVRKEVGKKCSIHLDFLWS